MTSSLRRQPSRKEYQRAYNEMRLMVEALKHNRLMEVTKIARARGNEGAVGFVDWADHNRSLIDSLGSMYPSLQLLISRSNQIEEELR